MAIDLGDAVVKIGGDMKGLTTALDGVAKQAHMSLGKLSMIAGAAMTAVGGAITGGLAKIVTSWANAGDQISEMSERTGMSTEALSVFKYAADETGTSIEGLEADVKRMSMALYEAGQESVESGKKQGEAQQKAAQDVQEAQMKVRFAYQKGRQGAGELQTAQVALYKAMQNYNTVVQKSGADTGTYTKALAEAGLSAKDFVGLNLDQKFTKMGLAIAQIPDPVMRTRLAMELMGKSGTNMIGVFAGGEAGLRKFTDAAGKANQIFSPEMAAKANAFNDSLHALTASFQGLLWSLAPLIADIANQWIPAITQTIQHGIAWVKHNQELVGWLVKVAAIVGAICVAVGPLLIMLPGLALAFGAIGGVVGAISSPFLIAAAAIGILAYAFRDTLRQALDAAVQWTKANWAQIVRIWDLSVRQVMDMLSIFGNILRAVFTVIGAVLTGFGKGASDVWAKLTGDVKFGSMSVLDWIEFLQRGSTIAMEQIALYAGRFANWIAVHWDSIVSGTRWMVANVLDPLIYLANGIVWVVDTIVAAWNRTPPWLRGAAFGGMMYGPAGMIGGAVAGAFGGGGGGGASSNTLNFSGPMIGTANITSGQDARKLAREFTNELGRIMGAQGQRLGALAS